MTDAGITVDFAGSLARAPGSLNLTTAVHTAQQEWMYDGWYASKRSGVRGSQVRALFWLHTYVYKRTAVARRLPGRFSLN